jgi:hypothetical protein
MDDWRAWEHEAARALGLDTTVSSGNQFYDKGDATTRGREDPFPLMVDCKLTTRASFSLNRKVLASYENQATAAGKRLVLPVRFLTPRSTQDYAVLSFHDLIELRNLCR